MASHKGDAGTALLLTFKGEVKSQSKKLAPKRKHDALAVQHSNSMRLRNIKKKTKSPKEKESPMYLPTTTDTAITEDQQITFKLLWKIFTRLEI